MNIYSIKKSNYKIRYHDLPGEEIPIIFIHGLGCASSYDYPQVASFASLNRHRRILVDLLGYGYSDKPIIIKYTIEDHAMILQELIDSLHLDKIVIFGHSMGGAIAIALAERIKKIVQCLIITEGNLDPGGGTGSRAISAYSEEDYINKGHKIMISENEKANNYHWITTMKISEPQAVYIGAKNLVMGSSPTWRELLYSFDFPRTYIFGDKSLPNSDQDELPKHGVAVRIVAGAGHNMATDNPEGLADAIYNGIHLTMAST